MELRRPPWYAGPLILLAGLVSLLYIASWLGQLAQGFKPAGAWRIQVGSQGFAVRIGPQVVGQGAPPTAAQPVGYELTTDAERWAYDLATRLGNPAPSFETIMFLVAWQDGEGTAAQYNPLATTQPMPGATCFNSLPSMDCGVKNYLSREDGLQATVDTLAAAYTGYQDIREGITSNDPERALSGLHVAPWGTIPATVEARYRELVAQVVVPPPTVRPEPALAAGEAEVRQQLVAYALSLQGIPYIRGGRSAEGGDCSGTMQHIYKHIVGIDIGATTYSQLPNLRPIELADVQPGDLWFGQFPDDQHTGMMADVNGDGEWDLVHNGADQGQMHVTYSFLTESYLGAHTIGFRRAL